MWAGGPPNPMQPSRPHCPTIVRSGTFGFAAAPSDDTRRLVVALCGDATGVVASRTRGQRDFCGGGAEAVEHARNQTAVDCAEHGVMLRGGAKGTVVRDDGLFEVMLLRSGRETVCRKDAAIDSIAAFRVGLGS